MPLTEAQKKANIKYRKENVKRIPLDIQKEKYEEIATAAKQAGESVNGYIKKAIDEKMERDGCAPAAPEPKQSKRETNTCPKPATAQVKNTSCVDLSRLTADIMYQFEVRDAFGEEILAELMEKAHNETVNQPDTARKDD